MIIEKEKYTIIILEQNNRYYALFKFEENTYLIFEVSYEIYKFPDFHLEKIISFISRDMPFHLYKDGQIIKNTKYSQHSKFLNNYL